jgi:hypothetical protein
MEAEASMVADATSELFASLTVAQPCQPGNKPAGESSGRFTLRQLLDSVVAEINLHGRTGALAAHQRKSIRRNATDLSHLEQVALGHALRFGMQLAAQKVG